MKKNLITSALAVLTFTVLLGLAYPLAMTGIAQVAFPNRADGSPIEVDGKVVGSRLLAQAWTVPVLGADGKPKKDADGNPVTAPDPKYFQPRPSQTDYDPHGTFFSNRGPNQASAKRFYRDQLKAYIALNGKYDRGLEAADVPQDAVTTSGSGVDPHISRTNAAIQAHRIAAVRHLPLARVQALIEANTDGRSLGLLGEPGVNTTELNLALDREAA
jgi:potassium-transporting ATPase KdpC subunit